MGNAAVTPCFTQKNSRLSSSVTLIFWKGTTRTLRGKHKAGEIMFEFPDKMVCHADSFFIGHRVPMLAIDDELMPGQTYFILPIDRFACNVLSASWFAALGSSSSPSPSPSSSPLSSSSCPKSTSSLSPPSSPIKFGECPNPFEYLRSSNGRVLIKVTPEFITKLIKGNNKENSDNNDCNTSNGLLCSTPELKKHYEQLVRSKDQVWSPKLETISEYNVRFSVSPCRFIGLQWKEKEKNVC